MSKNIQQVFATTPITSNSGTDLMYFGHGGVDAAMTFTNFSAQFSASGAATPAQVQRSAFNVGTDTGTADHYVVTLSPAIASYTNGLLVAFTPTHTSLTTAPDINVNGVGVIPIRLSNGSTIMAAGDIKLNTICLLEYSTALTAFVILDPIFSYANAGDVVAGQNYWFAPDTGAANAYVADIPLIVDQYNGFNLDPLILVLQNVAHSNTTASTITITGDGNPPFDILSSTGAALTGGEIVAGGSYFFFFNGINYYLLNAANAGGGGGVTATQVQQSAFNIGIDSGTADNYEVTLNPPALTYTNLVVGFIPLNTNVTNAPLLEVDGLGALPLLLNNPALTANPGVAIGDIAADYMCYAIYNQSANSFLLMNPQFSYANTGDIISGQNYFSGFDISGVDNAYIADIPYVNNLYNGVYLNPIFVVLVDLHVGNTGASTLSIPGSIGSPFQITFSDGTPLLGGEMQSSQSYMLYYNAQYSTYILLNPSLLPSIKTAPADSQASAITIDSVFGNPLGYDAVFTVYLEIDSATAADVLLGISTGNAPTQQTIISGLTVVATIVVPIPIYLPANSFCKISTSGTITASISGQIAMPV